MTAVLEAVREVCDLLVRLLLIVLSGLAIWRRSDLPRPMRWAVDAILCVATVWGIAVVALWLGGRADG